ncbi:hypothetical protein ACS0TY_011991 [Phlomoides rotata]
MSNQIPSPQKSSSSSTKPHITWSDSYSKAQSTIESLSAILPTIPPLLSSSETPATSLLHDPDVAAQISTLLHRGPDSGAVNDSLCAWLYDTFHSSEPDLHLVVLRFLPTLAGVYLSRAGHRPLPGFESVLLAIYSHETTSRNGQATTVSIPDLAHSSIYHETKHATKNSSTELHLAVISPTLEPHGTVRSARRARIVGVALELYYKNISRIPDGSKIEFCEFCKIWSGIEDNELQGRQELGKSEKVEGRRGRINLPWELLQPIVRILGHCLLRAEKYDELFNVAFSACRCLHARAMHDINAQAILATRSLLKLAEIAVNPVDSVDYTEITVSNVITIN